LSRKWAKSRTRGLKCHLAGAKACVGRARQTRADLEEQLKATSEILRIISNSPSESQSVLDAVAENAARLCNANNARIWRLEDNRLRLVAAYGESLATKDGREGLPADRETVTGRAACDRRTIHVHDIAAESSEYPLGSRIVKDEGWRTTLATPLLREGTPIGIILVRRMEVRPFHDKQIALLETFADQAVIAIENARLFEAEKQRTLALAHVNRDLAEREAKIRRLVEANIIGIFISGLEGRILDANDAFLNVVGYDRDDLVSGRVRWTDLTPPEWHEHDKRALAELSSNTIAQPYEKEFFRKDGSRVPVLIGGALFEEGGNEGVAFVLDLTERKRTEDALQRSEFYLSEAQRLAHMGSWAFNPSGFFNHWSHELFQIYGMDPQKGAPTLEKYLAIVHPQDRDFMSETIKRMHAERCGCDVKKRIIRPNGEVRYIRCVGIPNIQANVLKGFLGTAMDITEQELLTQELERRQAYLAEAQRLTHTGSWAWDARNQKVLYCSEEMFRIFGLDRESLPTRKRLRQRVHPDDREMVDERFERSLRGKLDDFDEYRIVLPDGTLKYINSIGHPVFDDDGSPIAFVGTAVDVTERKRAQQEHERLRELEADLAHMNRLSIMGELAASLVHEITQPMATARNNARAAIRFLDRAPPDLGEVREALACVVDDADRAGDIIDRIRDHIKKAPPRKDRFDLNKAINEVIELAQSAIAKTEVSVRTRLAEGMFPVQGDRVQLQQVVLNLILNAVEAMSSVAEGERELLISTEQRQTGGVLVAVRDSGPGIVPENLERVFEAFYTTKSTGVGMGLSICRTIVNAHGGRLWADVNAPRGAVFQLTLPDEEKELMNSLSGSLPDGRGDTVLDASRLMD
jgi:PAS domain S-box-containing protein